MNDWVRLTAADTLLPVWFPTSLLRMVISKPDGGARVFVQTSDHATQHHTLDVAESGEDIMTVLSNQRLYQ